MVDLFSLALVRCDGLPHLEDNTQCIAAARTGYSAALRHVALCVANEQFFGENVNFTLLYEGDMFTKKLVPYLFELRLGCPPGAAAKMIFGKPAVFYDGPKFESHGSTCSSWSTCR